MELMKAVIVYIFIIKRYRFSITRMVKKKPSIVDHVCNPRTWKAATEELTV
jgi:hypothetical protein